MKYFNKKNQKEFTEFIKSSTCPAACVNAIRQLLSSNGYLEFDESDKWVRTSYKKYYTIRGNSIIAVKFPGGLTGFKGAISHVDSPCYRVKYNPLIDSNGYTKLNVEAYGGPINYSWLDIPLGIAGEVAIKGARNNIIYSFDSGKITIPSQAIQINRDVNDTNPLNVQKDMQPIIGLRVKTDQFCQPLNKYECDRVNPDRILDYDLYLYNHIEPTTVGLNNEFLLAPRLDNLTSVYASLKAFICTPESGATADVFAAFNSEEIGSKTQEGADGTFLNDVLERVCLLYGEQKYHIFAKSCMLSLDVAHAVHPNAPEKSDPTNTVMMEEGVVFKHNTNYASIMKLSSSLKCLCVENDILFQDFFSRSDMKCGGTIGNISMSHHGIATVDVGIPLLGMHSATETIALKDMDIFMRFLNMYYEKM